MKRMLLALVAMVASLMTATAQRVPTGCEVGKNYIDVVGPQVNDDDQKDTSLSALIYNGKPTIVDFWASWCAPCRREIPYLEAIYKKYKGKVNVVGIAIGDRLHDTEKAIQELGITYPVISSLQEAAQLYGIESIPQIILIDGQGVIRANSLRGESIEDAIKIHIQ